MEEFGELLNVEFPNETINSDFIDRVIQECHNMFLEDLEEAYGNESRNSHPIPYLDWERSCEDETQKWDDETNGSWRIENDFG
jgi:hypothetical protein